MLLNRIESLNLGVLSYVLLNDSVWVGAYSEGICPDLSLIYLLNRFPVGLSQGVSGTDGFD